MKVNIKLLLIALLAMLLPVNFQAASEAPTDPPSWITIKYADLEQKSVSEYQMVTVTVSEKNMWWKNGNHEVEIDYNRDYLKLVNVAYYDGKTSTVTQDTREVSTDDNNFEVKYQFYLNPGYDVAEIPLTVTKFTDGEQTDQATVSIKSNSQTTPQQVEFGDAVLNYTVENYKNNGETVTYSAHFEVVENIHKKPITLELKKNNMKVSSEDDYTVELTSNDADIDMLEQNLYTIDALANQQFDLTITAQEEALSAKNDRVEFFIFLESNNQYARLEPTYFKSEKIKTNDNTRAEKYLKIKMVIASFFILLFALHVLFKFKQGKISDSQSE
ncbi:hypothetical protein RZE82_06865 [Mollicutes bacterium LVI A0039]|nr:hypothetical protein RZE82_06865 [Mollicutes bacterium LVI A0039]